MLTYTCDVYFKGKLHWDEEFQFDTHEEMSEFFTGNHGPYTYNNIKLKEETEMEQDNAEDSTQPYTYDNAEDSTQPYAASVSHCNFYVDHKVDPLAVEVAHTLAEAALKNAEAILAIASSLKIDNISAIRIEQQ